MSKTWAAVLCGLAGLAQAADFDVTAYGAKGDGKTDNTVALQKAIDACAAAGGGRVVVPPGVYMTYTLSLASGVDFHIERGATVRGGEDGLKYPLFPRSDRWRSERMVRWNRRAMFYTVGATNVAISGSGTIDGNARVFHHPVPGRTFWVRNSDTNLTGRCMLFVGCRDLKLSDFCVYQPTGWTCLILDCDRVQVHALRVECNRLYPNGDGLHFGACRDVTVSDCIIDSNDDSICIRSHQELMFEPKPCERVVVANCTLRSENAAAIRLGWRGDAGIRDIQFTNIVCPYSASGVEIRIPPITGIMPVGDPHDCGDPVRGRGVPDPDFRLDPFSVENVRFNNMRVVSGNAVMNITVPDEQPCTFLKNISFSNCRFEGNCPPIVRYRPEVRVENWCFRNVEFVIERKQDRHWDETGFFTHARDLLLDNVRWNYLN